MALAGIVVASLIALGACQHAKPKPVATDPAYEKFMETLSKGDHYACWDSEEYQKCKARYYITFDDGVRFWLNHKLVSVNGNAIGLK